MVGVIVVGGCVAVVSIGACYAMPHISHILAFTYDCDIPEDEHLPLLLRFAGLHILYTAMYGIRSCYRVGVAIIARAYPYTMAQ